MRRILMVGGIVAALAAAPSLAGARTYCDQRSHDLKVAGTVIGGVGGALIGNAITHNATGAVLGGVGGAVVGNQVARVKCYSPRAYSGGRASHAYRSGEPAYAPRPAAASCRYENRPYYDERGQLVYAPTQVCR